MRTIRIDCVQIAIRGGDEPLALRLARALRPALLEAAAHASAGRRAEPKVETIDAGAVTLAPGTPPGQVAREVSARVAAAIRDPRAPGGSGER